MFSHFGKFKDSDMFPIAVLALILIFVMGTAEAHERWILNPDQTLQLNRLAKPEIFTMFTIEGTSF